MRRNFGLEDASHGHGRRRLLKVLDGAVAFQAALHRLPLHPDIMSKAASLLPVVLTF
jgi:hypothetical protein